MTLYHGVKNPDNVKKIIDGGFKLMFIKPLWMNDYAVSAAKSKRAVEKFFGKRQLVILKFKFRGNVWKGDRFETLDKAIGIYASTHQAYTREVVKYGIDAADNGHTVYIYNPKKISNIEIA